MFREAYERSMLADPENVTINDGPWMQALWMPQGPTPQPSQASAFLRPVIVTRFDGRTTQISADYSTMTVRGMMDSAGQYFGDVAFDPQKHSVHLVGFPLDMGLEQGALVKISGLIGNEHLNGQVGQIMKKEGTQFHVAVFGGAYTLNQENVVPYNTVAVARSRGYNIADIQVTLASVLTMEMVPRLLWLEIKPPTRAAGADGPLGQIGIQFACMDVDGDNRICAGELRSFLWNLHLDDGAFEQVRKRFAPPGSKSSGDYIDLEDLLFILGRPHLLHPEVPIDALIYEGVASILGRRMTAHIDKDLSQEDEGIGCQHACAQHCASYAVSLILQIGTLVCLVIFILGNLDAHFLGDPDAENTCGYIALGAYVVYLVQIGCCVRLTTAFSNATEGLENVMSLMDKPRYEDPHFHWHVQCYHYVTVCYTETTTDSQGNRQTVHKTRQERRNTHSADWRGVIPSTDGTLPFVPQTAAQQTQIDTHLNLDFSRSNYHARFNQWCLMHHRDVHQDRSSSEYLPSRASSCLAVWVSNGMPWWLNRECYWLMNIFLCSTCFRWAAQARLGHQDYTYNKKCYNI